MVIHVAGTASYSLGTRFKSRHVSWVSSRFPLQCRGTPRPLFSTPLSIYPALTKLSSRSQWPSGLRRRSTAARLLRSWVRIPPGGMDVLSIVCCQVEVSATGWSLVQRSPTDCAALLCVIYKPREWGGRGQLGAFAPKSNKLLDAVYSALLKVSLNRPVFLRLFCSWPPPHLWAWFVCVAHSSFIDAVTYRL